VLKEKKEAARVGSAGSELGQHGPVARGGGEADGLGIFAAERKGERKRIGPAGREGRERRGSEGFF
jgi:hypothetical protein